MTTVEGHAPCTSSNAKMMQNKKNNVQRTPPSHSTPPKKSNTSWQPYVQQIRQTIEQYQLYSINYKGVCGEFGWVGFLVVCFLYKINSNLSGKYLLWEKVAQIPPLTSFFLGWVGLRWGVRRFHNNVCMLSNSTEVGKSQAPY